MSATLVQDLQKGLQELKNLEGRLQPLIKSIEDKDKVSGEKVKDLSSRHDGLEAELKEMSAALAETKAKLGEFEKFTARPELFGQDSKPQWKSIAERLHETKGMQEFLKDIKGGGNPIRPMDFQEVGPVYGTYEERKRLQTAMQLKDITGVDVLRNVFSTERLRQIIVEPSRPQRVRDLLTVIPTTAETILFVKETSFTNAAAGVAEGDVKPQSAFIFDDDSESVKTIAHWIPVNRQVLSDLTMLEAYLEQRLTEGLKLVEDVQLLYGDGTGQNLQGILTEPDIQEYSWSEGEEDDTRIDAIRRAITLAQLAFYPVTGIVLNPLDWEKIETTKSTHGLYVWVNVAVGADYQLWKLPVVVTTAIEEGDCALGAWRMGGALWDRESVNMRVSEHHSDFFIRNKSALLVEERLCATWYRPRAFVKVTFDEAPSGS